MPTQTNGVSSSSFRGTQLFSGRSLVASALLIGVCLAGCERESAQERLQTASRPRQASLVLPTSDQAIREFCGDCHAVPIGSSFPIARWDHEVRQGIQLYRESRRDDLTIPDVHATIRFFQRSAPEAYEFQLGEQQRDNVFSSHMVKFEGDPIHAISSLVPNANDDARPDLVMLDIWSGRVSRLKLTTSGASLETLAQVSNPSRVKRVDLDRDGIDDLLVTDLGSLNPQDTKEGSLWWLKGTAEGTFERVPLRLGLSRTSDIGILDADDDGDLDLIVGDFGLHFVGQIYLAENVSKPGGRPAFEWSVLDSRPGLVQIEILDLDGDGRDDIVTLVAQQFETLDVHLNRGEGRFERRTLFQLDDPASGSSGFTIADMDNDGDLDAVLTNGDTFDDDLPKPFHGIHLLTNEGRFPFDHAMVANMPGVYCARVGDIDLDGDLDIAAVSLLSAQQVGEYPSNTFDGVSWFEQTSSRHFQRHTMESNVCDSATCELLDWDLDGDLDVIAPSYDTELNAVNHLQVFLNSTR